MIDNIISWLSWIVDAFSNIVNWLSMTVIDVYRMVYEWLPLGDTLVGFLDALLSNVVIGGYPLADMSLLIVMIGAGVYLYVCYQFVTWLANLIT